MIAKKSSARPERCGSAAAVAWWETAAADSFSPLVDSLGKFASFPVVSRPRSVARSPGFSEGVDVLPAIASLWASTFRAIGSRLWWFPL